MQIKRKRRRYRQRERVCSHCGGQVFSSTKRCPHCDKPLYNHIEDMERTERNRQVVMSLKTGLFTLQEHADKYNLTRERIRQIWEKSQKTGYKKLQERRRRVREKQKEESLDTVKFYCRACKEPVTYREGSKKHHLCVKCNYILMVLARDPYVLFTCEVCKTKYHPQRNHKYYKSKKNYCTTDCYNGRFLVKEK